MKLFRFPLLAAQALCAFCLLSITLAQTKTEDAAWRKLIEAGQRGFDQANYADAEKQFMAALERAQTLKSQKAIAESCEALAKLYDEQEKFEQAELHYLCLLEAQEKILGRDNYLLGETLFKLIEVYGKNNQYEKAAEMALRFQKIVEKKFSPNHQEAVGLLEMAGFLYAMGGNQAEAEKYIKLAEARKAASEKKTPRIADGDDLLRQDENGRRGMAAQNDGKYAEAEQHFRTALKLAEESGRRDYRLAVVLEALAGNANARQKQPESIPFYERAVALREELLPWDTPELLPRLSMLSFRISNLTSAYEAADREAPATRQRWSQSGAKEMPKVESLLKKNIALWKRAVGTGGMGYAVSLSSLKKYYLDRFNENYIALTDRLRTQQMRQSGQNRSGESLKRSVEGEIRRDPYFIKAMELWNRSLAIVTKLVDTQSLFFRSQLEEMARFLQSYGLKPEQAALEKRIAAIDAAPKQPPGSDFEYLKRSARERRLLGQEEEATEIEARVKVLEAATAEARSQKDQTPKPDAPDEKNAEASADNTRFCHEMNIFALLGPVFTLPLWDQPEFRLSGDKLLAGIRSRWGNRLLLEGKFGEVNPDTLKLTVMTVAEHGKLWEEAKPLVRAPHQHNRKYEFVQNAKGETEVREVVADPRGIALEPDGTARAEFTIKTEFAERKKDPFENFPTRYPRLSLLKLEIFDGEKKLGEQIFKNTRSDWMTNFFASTPEGYRGFRPISWMKAGNRRILIFDNLAEHDSLYGGAFVMCVLPAKP